MLNWLVHYKNKYPGCRVIQSESALDVFKGDDHLVAIRKNGANQWVDESEKYGCVERHDLAPIPKDARVHKVQDGKVGLDEEHAERMQKREKFLENGKVLSIQELKADGFKFDESGRMLEEPAKK